MAEAYIRGNTIKYIRVPDEVINEVQEERFSREGALAPGRGARAYENEKGGTGGREASTRARETENMGGGGARGGWWEREVQGSLQLVGGEPPAHHYRKPRWLLSPVARRQPTFLTSLLHASHRGRARVVLLLPCRQAATARRARRRAQLGWRPGRARRPGRGTGARVPETEVKAHGRARCSLRCPLVSSLSLAVS